jgi:hypothetical protein
MPEPNPNPDLFTTFERLETCHRVEVTEDNLAAIAKEFGWSVNYATEPPRLRKPDGGTVEIGSWIDYRGSRWNPEPLTQGWLPAGTYVATEPRAALVAAKGNDEEESA